MILLDTNLLTRMTRPLHPQCGVARAAIQTCRGRGERLIVVPQNLYEILGRGDSAARGAAAACATDALATGYSLSNCQLHPTLTVSTNA